MSHASNGIASYYKKRQGRQESPRSALQLSHGLLPFFPSKSARYSAVAVEVAFPISTHKLKAFSISKVDRRLSSLASTRVASKAAARLRERLHRASASIHPYFDGGGAQHPSRLGWGGGASNFSVHVAGYCSKTILHFDYDGKAVEHD